MAKTSSRIALALIALMGVIVLAVVTPRAARAISEWSIDGPMGLANGLLVGEDTVFSEGYSAEAFRKIEVGMARAEVHALLGEPLGSWTVREPDWFDAAERFSLSPGDTNYRLRFVYYAADLVVETRGEYYID